MADPRLCDIQDIRTVLTIDDVADLHEILDLREAALAKSQAAQAPTRTKP